MSQAEALLNSMTDEVPVHTHPVPDTDTYFIIDPITRKIENTNRKKTVIMQYDHNSERFTFELPRFVDGHDMLECTSVTVNVDNIEADTEEPRINSDAPDMTDLRIHPADPEKVISSWLITRNSTQLAGILSFHIEYKCVDSDGNVVYEWGTDTYNEIEVRARKKNGEAAVAEHTDLLEQWRTRIFGAGDSVMANIAAEGEAQVAAVKAESETQQEAVELKGAETLDSIPEDYTEVDAMAEEAVRSKADAIICSAEGESIFIKDSSNDHIRGLKLFGKSTQKTVSGAQLFDANTNEIITTNDTTHYSVNDDKLVYSASHVYSVVRFRVPHKHFIAGNTYVFECDRFTKGLICQLLGNDVTNGRALIDVRIMNTTNRVEFTIDKDVDMSIFDTFDHGVAYLAISLFFADEAYVDTDLIVEGLRLYSVDNPMTEWEPYTGGIPAPNPEYPQELVSIENPTVDIYGKNLLNITATTQTSNGVTFTIKEDKSVVINGTATADTYCGLTQPFVLNPGKYILSGCTDGSSNTYFLYADTGAIYNQNSEAEFIIDTPSEKKFLIKVHSGVTVTNAVVKPMLRLAEVADNVYDAPIEAQSVGLNYTLLGIPVTSGGNYTDENGQQWICDEVDLERGVYVRRIEQYVYDGSEDENWKNGYSSNGKNNRFELILMGVPIEHEVCESNNAAFVAKNAYCSHFDYQRTSTRPDVNNFRISKSVTAVQDWWYMLFVPDTTIVPLEDLDAWKTYLAENPMTVMAPLNTPIETPLTAEEITAFKALRTNYPNTTILNDAGAWMSVKYNADTKTYVENPKILKLTDSSTGVVYELKIVDGNLTVVPV